jgi:hypothetical protein
MHLLREQKKRDKIPRKRRGAPRKPNTSHHPGVLTLKMTIALQDYKLQSQLHYIYDEATCDALLEPVKKGPVGLDTEFESTPTTPGLMNPLVWDNVCLAVVQIAIKGHVFVIHISRMRGK